MLDCLDSYSPVNDKEREVQLSWYILLNQHPCLPKSLIWSIFFCFSLTSGEKAEVRGAQGNNSGSVPEKKRMMCVRLADIDWSGCAAVYGRPYRDRVIHLLALSDYKEPELLARLQRDGVRQKDKDSLGKILQQVRSWSLCQQFFQHAVLLEVRNFTTSSPV